MKRTWLQMGRTCSTAMDGDVLLGDDGLSLVLPIDVG